MKTITFDMVKIAILKNSYDASVEFCEAEFQGVNLNSGVQVKSYFREKFSLVLPDTKISTVNFEWTRSFADTPQQEALYALLTFLRSKFTLKNYINCVIKHEKQGIVTLREVDERLLMPNKQPISYNEEMIDCIVEACDEVNEAIKQYRSKDKQRSSVL